MNRVRSYKIDLHTHSVASHDGGIKPLQFRRVLENGILDCLAITDHNTVELALEVQQEFGDKIIVGEEIMTTHGEIIGLYLTDLIPPRLSPLETVKAIKDQGGIVYIPHPFETIRYGLSEHSLSEIEDYIDIVEIHNGRAFFQNRGPKASAWSKLHHKTVAAGSDAHGATGFGTTYVSVESMPDRKTLVDLLNKGKIMTDRPHLRGLLSPKANKLKRKLGRH